MASKTETTKASMGYMPRTNRTCGDCARFKSDMQPIPWMVEHNKDVAEGLLKFAAPYDLALPQNQREHNLRCGLGGFAVKKTGYCGMWEEKK